MSESKPELCSYLDAENVLTLVRPILKSLHYVAFPSSIFLLLTGVVRTRMQTFTILF